MLRPAHALGAQPHQSESSLPSLPRRNRRLQSTQGHTWTAYGRATDFDERTWSDDARPVPLSGVGDIGKLYELGANPYLIRRVFRRRFTI